jgi:CubicO group peptidase (beta-lactamase class C family)
LHAVTRPFFALALVLGLASALVAQGSDAAGPPSLDGAALEGLRAELAGIVAASPVPGVAVGLVTRSDAAWTAGFGEADRSSGRPVTPATLFRTNSVSKSLVALAVLRVRARGGLTLEAPLRALAPDVAFENAWADTHTLRLVHLLEHTSGFDELHLREYAFEPGDGSLLDALAVNPAPRAARWPPGTRMAYNNGAYAVVAHVLEMVTGRRFGEVVAREILEPLGMSSSGFGLDAVDRDRLAVAYLAPDRVEPTAPYPLLVQPAGAFISSAADLALLVGFFLRRGAPLLPESAVARMETPTTTDAARAGLRLGYGLGSFTATAGGHVWHGHAGGTPSAYARYAYEPALGVGYVVLMNGNDGATRRRIEAALQGALVRGADAHLRGEPGVRNEAGVPPTALAPFEGVYRQSTSNWQLTAALERLFDARRIDLHGGALVARPLFGGTADTLQPAATGGAVDRGDRLQGEAAGLSPSESGKTRGLHLAIREGG